MSVKEYLIKLGIPVLCLLTLYLLNPYNTYVFSGYLITVFILFNPNFFKNNLDQTLLVILVFSIVYALFFSLNPVSGKQYIFLYAILPSSFYLIGKYVNERFESNSQDLFYMFIFTSLLFSSTGILSVFTDILKNGFNEIDRNLPSFWTGVPITATKMGSYFALNMCIPAVLLGNRNKSGILFYLILIVIFLISLVCVLRIGSRTQLAIGIITTIISLLYLIPKQSVRRNFITTVIIAGIVSYTLLNINFDLEQDWLSAFAGRMEENGAEDIASGGGRVDRWSKALVNLFEKPLGWEVEEFGHVHNLWLDILRIGGIISLFSFLIFTVRSMKIVRQTMRITPDDVSFKNQILVYFLSFFLLFMVEPILEGTFDYFTVFCFFLGILASFNEVKYQLNTEKT